MGGSSKAPQADPAIGEAAKMSAETGRQMLDFMKGQSEIATNWAGDDREHYLKYFRPLERTVVDDARNWDTRAKREAAATKAQASAVQAGEAARQMQVRQDAAMGVKPGSGRSSTTNRMMNLRTQLAGIGAGNQAREALRAQGTAMRAAVAGMGQGTLGNSGSLLGMAGNSGAAGFQGAMSGYGQQSSILNQDFQNRMASYQQNQSGMDSLFSGIGGLLGTGMSMGWFSSEEAKTDKRPARGALRAVQRMRVDEWSYKPGKGDGGRHIGPYAEEFHRETGRGDGRSIPVIDAVGVTMGAVKELSDKVDKLARGARGARRASS